MPQTQTDQPHTPSIDNAPGTGRRSTLIFMGVLTIALFFLLSDHRTHALAWLPLLLLAACPLMHMFMHGGHRHGTDDRQGDGPAAHHGKRERGNI